MSTARQLILGSSLKPRSALLQRLQLAFEIATPDVDETPAPNKALLRFG